MPKPPPVILRLTDCSRLRVLPSASHHETSNPLCGGRCCHSYLHRRLHDPVSQRLGVQRPRWVDIYPASEPKLSYDPPRIAYQGTHVVVEDSYSTRGRYPLLAAVQIRH